MTTRRAGSGKSDPVARRSLEILDQMTEQLLGNLACDPARLEHIRSDFTKLVHWALHEQGNPDVVARIRECYHRCEVDIDDTRVMRRVRGVVKGVLRKAGVDTTVPGVDPALDPPTITLSTRRTIQHLGSASSSSSQPSPALVPKQVAGAASSTRRRRQLTATRAEWTPSEMRAAFDKVTTRTVTHLRSDGRSVAKADVLAAIYNDPERKAHFLAQIAAELPKVDLALLAPSVDGFFRDAFKSTYIERTDRMGNRRAHKR